MKAFLSLTFALLVSTPAFAGVKVTHDCNSYGPQANNLALSDDMDDFIQIGYLTMGVFFPVKMTGCKSVSHSKGEVFCDGKRIGTLGKFESTSDNGGEPRADLTLDSSVNAELSGSCKRGGPGLTLQILK